VTSLSKLQIWSREIIWQNYCIGMFAVAEWAAGKYQGCLRSEVDIAAGGVATTERFFFLSGGEPKTEQLESRFVYSASKTARKKASKALKWWRGYKSTYFLAWREGNQSAFQLQMRKQPQPRLRRPFLAALSEISVPANNWSCRQASKRRKNTKAKSYYLYHFF